MIAGDGRTEDGLGFDAVVMLTWSDWHNEPRSNRYHYATRLARHAPVLFCQVLGKPGAPLDIAPSDHPGIDIVNFAYPVIETDVQALRRLLYARGIRKPLIWIYNVRHFDLAVTSFPSAFKVFHATEDYFTPTSGIILDTAMMKAAFAKLRPDIDLLVAVSPGVLKSYREQGQYRGDAIVLENGCDAGFFFKIADGLRPVDRHADLPPVALFQGGVNARLDYQLLERVARRLPGWTFQFCGQVVANDGWRRLSTIPNVTYLGVLGPDMIGRAMCEATVGVIPFVADRWIKNSLPLKAYEYVACGLPVVTVPIDALARRPELFEIAADAEAFALAIEKSTPTRFDEDKLAIRRQAASENSYDSRFTTLIDRLRNGHQKARSLRRQLRIGMLYDAEAAFVGTIREHLDSFRKYSEHEIIYIPATQTYWSTLPLEEMRFDFSAVDVLIVHYSVRLSLEDHAPTAVTDAVQRFPGVKILFIQDEYENTETARRWMDRFAFDIVYTCVPKDQLDDVYPAYRYPATEFRPTLTGYVPEAEGLDNFILPHEQRRALIGYRGRKLPFIYGDLGQEKYRIGLMVRDHAKSADLPVDIEMDDDKRIYGDGWYEFLGSARATLGTESGSTIFDVDGGIAKDLETYAFQHPDAGYEDIRKAVLKEHEGKVRMNQISPKIFEAIMLRTALILFEGEYSGVVQAGRHYIPLNKDGSNLDEVFRKLEDIDLIMEMTERAYDDVILSGRYSYQTFVQGVDADIGAHMQRTPKPRPCFVAATIPDGRGRHRTAWPPIPTLLSGPGSRTVDLAGPPADLAASMPDPASFPLRVLLKATFLRVARGLHRRAVKALGRKSAVHRQVMRVWKGLPDGFRLRIKRVIHS